MSCPYRLCVAVLLATFVWTAVPTRGHTDILPDTIARVRRSVVGIGSWKLRRTPPSHYLGTGFVVADGRHCLTNAHVVAPILEGKDGDDVLLKVFALGESGPSKRVARVIAQDPDHDLALLAFEGAALPALFLGDSRTVREGEAIAFTGFPLGMALGLHPATHRGSVAAIVPVADPALSSRELNAQRIKRLRNPFSIFQLDATAYPGNSGSPLYRPATGEVVAVINSVFVKGSKESAIKFPSGITYAIPVDLAKPLLEAIGK